MKVIPVGLPSLVNPLGTTAAGWPVRFVIQRFKFTGVDESVKYNGGTSEAGDESDG